jgi:hypothetical protein
MWEMMTAQLIQNNDNIKRGEDDEFSLASPLTQASLLFFVTLTPFQFLPPPA